MRAFNIVCLLICLEWYGIFCANGQMRKVSGIVKNSTNNVISAASITITQKSNHKLLGFSTTDTLGHFSIVYNSKEMPVILHIRHISYQNDSLLISGQRDTSTVFQLIPYRYTIEEVTVKAKRKPFEYQNGDLVVNIENFIDTGTTRTVDVLKKLPGIFVNESGKQITLNGKPVELQIDGRKQTISYEILKALPVNLLDQITLVPNKRAEHDGNANTAIIDVKTKKKFVDGYVGTLDGDYGTYRGVGWPGETEGSFFTMLMKKDFYLNINLHTEKTIYDENIYDSTYYESSQNYLTSEQKAISKPWASFVNMNSSWNISKGHRISTNLYGFIKTKNKFSATEGIEQQRNRRFYYVKSDGNRWNVSGNIEYESSDSLPFKLKVSYGYIGAGDKNENNNDYVYPDKSKINYDYRSIQQGRQHILKTDFRKFLLDKKIVLNAGVKLSFGKTKDDSQYNPVLNSLTNEYFEYLEKIMTGYISGGWQISRKVYVNSGIRAEYTDYNSKLKSTEEQGSNQYWNWLPYMNVFLYLHKNYTISLSFSSTIGRPNYNMLAPGKKWYNDHYYSKGNPFLQPCKNNAFVWGNQIFQKLNLTLGGRYIQDLYHQVLLDKGQEITEDTYTNSFDSWMVSVNFTLPLSFLDDRLYIYLTGNGQYGKYRNFKNGFVMPVGRNKQQNISTSFAFEFSFTQQRRLKIYAISEYSILSKSFQSNKKPTAEVNMGINYKCMKNRPFYLTFFSSDILNLKRTKNIFYYGNNTRHFHLKEKSQGFYIGLEYEFQGGKDLKREEIRKDVNATDKRFEEN